MMIIRRENDRRSMGEAPDDDDATSSTVLASQRTLRRDPMDHFKLYHGGWNVTNYHYLASVAFTAAPPVVIGAVWFAVFGITLLLVCICHCCCRRKSPDYSPLCYKLTLAFLSIFTIAAILGCVLLFSGQTHFFGSTAKVVNFIRNQVNSIIGYLKEILQSLGQAKDFGVERLTLPDDFKDNINEVQTKIESAANTLSTTTDGVFRTIQDVLKRVRLYLNILAGIMLFVVTFGFVVSLFGLECVVYTLVILGWILVTLTFLLCGVFLFLHNVVSDSCVAMDQWLENPTAHTALDEILPCVDKATANEILMRTHETTQKMVGIVDVMILNVANNGRGDLPLKLLNYNQSGPLVPAVCNPYNEDLTTRNCEDGVELSKATEELKKYVCETKEVDGYQVCVTTGRLTPRMYTQISSAVGVSYALYRFSPFLVELVDCTFVRNTFRNITNNNCPGLRKYTDWIYIGLLVVSTAVMFSLILWVIYAKERKQRLYTKQFNIGIHK